MKIHDLTFSAFVLLILGSEWRRRSARGHVFQPAAHSSGEENVRSVPLVLTARLEFRGEVKQFFGEIGKLTCANYVKRGKRLASSTVIKLNEDKTTFIYFLSTTNL